MKLTIKMILLASALLIIYALAALHFQQPASDLQLIAILAGFWLEIAALVLAVINKSWTIQEQEKQ